MRLFLSSLVLVLLTSPAFAQIIGETEIIVLLTSPAFAQIAGETEVGSDGQGERFFSQYVFIDTANIGGLARYFWVNDAVHRGEFTVGPTFKIGKLVLKPQIGATTDKQVMVALVVALPIMNRRVLYIGDRKLTTQTGESHQLYQKLFVAVTPGGALQFRMEDLLIGSWHGFQRIGIEGRYNLSGTAHVYVAPFYDTVRRQIALQTGFRF